MPFEYNFIQNGFSILLYACISILYNILSVWPHQMCFMNADSWTAEPRTWFHKLNDQWALRSSQSSTLYKHAVILPLVVFIWSVHDLYCIFPNNYYPNAYSIVAYILLQLMIVEKCVLRDAVERFRLKSYLLPSGFCEYLFTSIMFVHAPCINASFGKGRLL